VPYAPGEACRACVSPAGKSMRATSEVRTRGWADLWPSRWFVAACQVAGVRHKQHERMPAVWRTLAQAGMTNTYAVRIATRSRSLSPTAMGPECALIDTLNVTVGRRALSDGPGVLHTGDPVHGFRLLSPPLLRRFNRAPGDMPLCTQSVDR
jgi:hypothetical protein